MFSILLISTDKSSSFSALKRFLKIIEKKKGWKNSFFMLINWFQIILRNYVQLIWDSNGSASVVIQIELLNIGFFFFKDTIHDSQKTMIWDGKEFVIKCGFSVIHNKNMKKRESSLNNLLYIFSLFRYHERYLR